MMNTLNIGIRWLAAALVMASGAALAQSAPGPGPGQGPGWAASAPRGMRGPGMGPRAGRGNTFGWSMMSGEERRAHQARMSSMSSYGECKTYMEQHHEQMVERAKERGVAMPAEPRRDACIGLKDKP